jgi:hypothetical protein
MDDSTFETQLSRLFAQAQPFPDSLAFAGQIERRLGRGWALRRTLIAGAGVAGGLITVGQMIGSGLMARIDGASHVFAATRQGLSHLPLPFSAQLSALSDLPFGGEVAWLVVGLAVLAGALLAGRSLEDR